MSRGRSNDYTADELAWLEEHHAFKTKDLGRFFRMFFPGRDHVTDDALRNTCQRYGWLTGRTGCFPKGSIPPNKGRRGWHAPGSEKGWFKKGQMPSTFRGHGHEYIDNKDGYVWLIVEDNAPRPPSTPNRRTRSVLKHRYMWEQANGPIPEGHVLKCLSGDKTDCDPSNWVLIPQALLPRLAGGNRYRNLLPFDEAPAELKPVLLATAKLEHEAAQARRRAGRLTANERYRDRRKTQRQAAP